MSFVCNFLKSENLNEIGRLEASRLDEFIELIPTPMN